MWSYSFESCDLLPDDHSIDSFQVGLKSKTEKQNDAHGRIKK